MTTMQPEAEEIVAQYIRLTGREARVAIYEHSLFDFIRAGFSSTDFVCVVTFLLRENKRNKFQYSLKLGHLINDHQRFMDLLGEAKAKERNRIKPATPKEAVLQAWRPTCGERVNGASVRRISDILKAPP